MRIMCGVTATMRSSIWSWGVGANTPGIIKYNFWRQVLQNPKAQYICVNKGEAFVPQKIAARSIALNCDIRDLFASIPHTS